MSAPPNKVVVISGGSRGLGAAIVEDLLEHGWSVATFSRSKTDFVEKMSRAAGEKRFRWEAIDGTHADAVRRFVMMVARDWGRLDAGINNAAVLQDGLLATLRPQDITATLAVNLEGAVHLAQACCRAMLPQRSGVILNISSLNGIRGNSGVSVYSAAKAGLDGLTRSLARELGPAGIRVNSIAPGYFDSDMTGGMSQRHLDQILRRTPVNRLGTVADLVGVVRFCLSDDARFITGQTLVVDGGITC